MSLFALIGWGASELKSVAKFLNGTTEERLEFWQKIIVALAAGVGTFFAVLYFLGWSKMAAYFLDFFAAYTGARYLDTLRDGLLEAAKAMIARGATKPPDAKP